MIKSSQYLKQQQTQQQRLSPQQIQYIKLLQLPTLALEQRVQEELEMNPVLEEADDSLDQLEEDNWDEQEDLGDKEETEPVDQNEEIDWDQYLENTEFDGENYSTTYNPDRAEWRDLPKPYQESQLEELEQQVSLLDLDEKEQLIADQILGSLDTDGYFRRDIEAVIDHLAFNQGLMVSEDDVERVRKQIQQLDPPGIASRDLRDCLLVQLELMPDDTPGREAAIRIIRDEWEAFEKKHFSKLQKRLDLSEEELREAYDCITGLDPKPGGGASVSDTENYVEPDFEVYYRPAEEEDDVEEEEGEFIIRLNNRNVPPLRISPKYKEMWDNLKKKKKKTPSTKETQHFIKSKIESAQWFIDSIRQRQNTLMNTMRTIVALQDEFFKYGEGLRPMILKDIADRVGLDISTISRVVNGKYVQTDFGVFELKYFFSEGLETESGEEVSSREVKKVLQNLVDNENKSKPLSDQALARELKKQGFKVARRTVSKYREQENIPVARLRKQI